MTSETDRIGSELHRRINRGVQLLVEGKDARNFFEAFVRRLSLNDIEVQDFGGVDQLRQFLAAFVNESDFGTVRSIGVVRDAELSAAAAFQSVRDALEHSNLVAPQRPGESTSENPSVRVLILPGDGQPGMLETLLCRTLNRSPLNRCVDDFLQCAEESGHRVQRRDKARAHAWLATQPLPHVSVGVAALKGYWDLDHQALDAVRQFLTAL